MYYKLYSYRCGDESPKNRPRLRRRSYYHLVKCVQCIEIKFNYEFLEERFLTLTEPVVDCGEYRATVCDK